MHGQFAGTLSEQEKGRSYLFEYAPGYAGAPVSLTMPVKNQTYSFEQFPPFFEGLLPEGIMLAGLLRRRKIDRDDLLSQLIATGEDLVGAVTVELMENE